MYFLEAIVFMLQKYKKISNRIGNKAFYTPQNKKYKFYPNN